MCEKNKQKQIAYNDTVRCLVCNETFLVLRFNHIIEEKNQVHTNKRILKSIFG